MAHMHNLSNRQRQSSWMSDIGNKIRTVAEVAGTAHGIYQLGKAVYQELRRWVPWWRLLDCYYNFLDY